MHVSSFVSFSTSLLGLLSLCSAHLSGLVDWSGSKLNMLLWGDSNQVTGDVDKLFADCDVSLSDQDSWVVHWVGKLSLEDQSLESSLHHLWKCETQDVIKFLLVFFEETESYHSSNKGITYINFIINSILNNLLPSKSLLGSFSSKVKSSLAAFLKQKYEIKQLWNW
jgi:hypothetical protein